CLSRSGDRSYRLMRHRPVLIAIWRSLLQTHAPPSRASRDLEIAPTGSCATALCLSRSGDRAYRLTRHRPVLIAIWRSRLQAHAHRSVWERSPDRDVLARDGVFATWRSLP